eukprot:COSAG01_NODE_7525_length_3166_cov_17.369416_3_plen_266_part_00
MASAPRVLALAAVGLGACVYARRATAAAAAEAPPKKRPGRFMELSGAPFQRGQQHGQALRAEIGELFALWRAQLCSVFGGGTADAEPSPGHESTWMGAFAAEFLRATDYQTAIEKWAPGLLDEVRGLAAGSGIDFEQMLTFQLMDEYWFHGAAMAAAARPGQSPPEHCTAFGVPGEKGGSCPALVAQTMDLESFRDGYQVVFKIVPAAGSSEPAALLFSHAGMVALCGVNAAGISVVVNNLSQLKHGTRGLPVRWVCRPQLRRSR